MLCELNPEEYDVDNPSEYAKCPNYYFFKFIEDNLFVLIELSEHLKTFYEYTSFVSFFINMFHLFVLLQKELRSNLVYLIMAGICLCDILQSLGNMAQVFMLWDIVYKIEICFTNVGHKYFHLMVNLVAKTVQIMSRRCSSFLALYIAIIRTLSVMFPMSGAVTTMTKPKTGFLVMIMIGICCSAWSSAYFIQTKLEKILYCSLGVPKPSYIPYKFKDTQQWEFKYFFIDGSVAIVVSVFYVVVAILLVVAIGHAKRRTKSLKNESKSSNTSAFVIVMMITVFLSELTYGSLYLGHYLLFGQWDDYQFFANLNPFVWSVLMFTSTIHAVICLFMSSQYRDTVKRLLGMDKKPKVEQIVVSVVQPKACQTKESSNASSLSKKTF